MIMEYEKKYKNALEWARQLMNGEIEFIRKDVEKVFPELKESEDERIRKELLQIAKESEDSFYMVMTPDKRKHLITWLEKQGERKSDWSEEDEAKLKSILFHIEDVENKNVIDWLKSIKDRVQPKQEWSKEDEERIKSILSVLDVQVCWDGATGKKGNPYQKEIDWLKSLRPKNGWKPTDKDIFELQCVINNGPYNGFILKALLEQLKKLRGE